MIEATEQNYLDFLLSLLPPGQMANDADSNWAKIFTPYAKELARLDGRARGLLKEADPRTTSELFSEWESFAGLPDICTPDDLSYTERRDRLIQKLKTAGGQSRAYFIALAETLGYTITITEYRPFTCGVDQCIAADSAVYVTITNPEDRFVWDVSVDGPRATWFHCGESECGVDPMLKLTVANDLECIFNRLKPAHTKLNFIYQEA